MSKLGINSVQPAKDKSPNEVNTLLKKDDPNIQYGGVSATEDAPLLDAGTEKQSVCMKFYEVLVTLTIEPIVFCFMFAFLLNMSIMSNMMMDKACLFHFNYSAEVCKNLSGHPKEKEDVEIMATNFSLYANLMSLVGAFFMIFIAPWSDKYGRKPPLLFAVFGTMLTDVGLILCSYHLDTKLEYLIISRIPSEIFGGFICVLTVIYSYASEVSSEKNRTLKYLAVEIAMGVGMALGALTGGFLYRYYGYFYVYVTVGGMHSFCFVWILFVVKESVEIDPGLKWIDKLKDFFVCQSFKNGIQVTFRKREGGTRPLLLLLLLSMCIVVLTYESFGTIGYIFVHHIYDWDPTTYSIVTTTVQLSQMVFSLVIVPVLVRVFKMQDFTLGLIGAISMMAKNLIIGFSMYHKFIFYLGQLSGFFGQLCLLSVRTAISKMVEKEELGRIFAFLATCEAVIPMLGSVAVTKLFEATLDLSPNITYCVSAVLLFLPVGTFLWGIRRKRNFYVPLSVSADDHVIEKA